jgi:hypothetical protein
MLSAAVGHAVNAHPDGKIVTSLFCKGRVCAATLLAEIGDDRARFVSGDHLAAEGGAAPVTRESRKQRAVTFRWACNMRLRQALVTLADTNPWARAVYQQARDRSCEHAHAIRILARTWCRVFWTCWQKREAYDPTKHRAARQFTFASSTRRPRERRSSTRCEPRRQRSGWGRARDRD